MRHIPVRPWQLTMFFCACLVSPAVADEKESRTYFPTKVAAKWEYEYDGKKETEEVTAVKKENDSFMVTVHRVDGFGRKSETELKVAKDGLFRLTGGPAVKHPPMWLLKLPHKPGAKWETWTGAQGSFDSEVRAFGPEKIDVPAGKFDAIRTETLYPQVEGDGIVGKCWYAPGVGLVKSTYGNYVRVLKSFSPGKD